MREIIKVASMPESIVIIRDDMIIVGTKKEKKAKEEVLPNISFILNYEDLDSSPHYVPSVNPKMTT